MSRPRFDGRRGGNLIGLALAAMLVCLGLPGLLAPAAGAARPPQVSATNLYRQTNLVSDLPGVALIEDKNLVNPWGVALSPSSPFWVANQGSGTATLYSGDVGGGPLVKNPGLAFITVPPGGGPTQPARGVPTGVVAGTSTTDFVVTNECFNPPCPGGPARFIFAELDGSIAAWHPDLIGARAVVVASQPGHAYTGLAIGSNASGGLLYAADFANGRIDVYGKTFSPTTVAGNFNDSTVPADFHPFNIQNLGGALYVTYAQFNQFSQRPNSGAGFGLVRKFDLNGVRDPAFAVNQGGPLNAPWGLALAPAGFGEFGGSLLVGNFGDSIVTASVNAFDPATGAHRGSLKGEDGADLKIEKLWALAFGNGTAGGDPGTLYFTAGLDNERHGLFGSLKPNATGPSSLMQFSPPFSPDAFFTREGEGHIDISVRRTGDVTAAATVNYATFDGDATQKSDYEIALGTLTFNPGERVKTFRVLVVDDNNLAAGTSVDVNLILSNPSGAGLGNPKRAKLFIMDDEFDTPKQGNPIDDPAFFVRQHYFDFLNREPDDAGRVFWTNQITSCGADAACVERRRINVSAAFFLSIEFQQTGFLVYRAHKAATGELPRYGQFMRDTQQISRGVIVGEGDWRGQLEANKRAFFDEFVTRPEFVSKFPASLTNRQYVEALLASAQLSTSTGRLFVARLEGSQEVPPKATPAKGYGIAQLTTVTPASDTISVMLSFGNLSSAETAAHIHGPAPAGSNAPVIKDLPLGQIGDLQLTLTREQGRDLRSGLLYFDVHTQNNPDGEIRGQLPVQLFLLDVLVRALDEGTLTRAQVLRQVAEDADFRARELNPAFVLMQYFGYLRRNPDDPPDADLAGYNFWLTKLNQFGGNFEQAEMVKAFITSGEYRRRFRQGGSL